MDTVPQFIGIDCAAESFAAALYRAGTGIVTTIDAIDNTIDGYQRLEQALQSHGCQTTSSIICVEATGVYCEHLCYWLHSRGWAVVLEAPAKVKRSFHARAKTDRLDAQQIAEYACRFADQLQPWLPNDAIVEQIGVLLSTREQLSGQLTANRNALKAVERKYIDTPAARRIYTEMIGLLKDRLKQIEQEIKRLISSHPTLSSMITILMSAPGVGLLLAANLAVATHGFRTAIDYRQLASYVGICPYEHQSGTSVHRPARSCGFGPSRIRKLLYLASLSVRRNNSNFSSYYARKVAEGKVGRLVINNIANKLLRVLCSMIKNKRPYCSSHRSVNPAVAVTA
jgi:transposase